MALGMWFRWVIDFGMPAARAANTSSSRRTTAVPCPQPPPKWAPIGCFDFSASSSFQSERPHPYAHSKWRVRFESEGLSGLHDDFRAWRPLEVMENFRELLLARLHFHSTFDYYADGVAPNTATLPIGWEDRLVRFSNENTHGAVACFLDPVDLAYAKLAAGRPKDIDFIVELTRYHLITISALIQLIEQVEDPALKKTEQRASNFDLAARLPGGSTVFLCQAHYPRARPRSIPASLRARSAAKNASVVAGDSRSACK
jgi:hypothetical protein